MHNAYTRTESHLNMRIPSWADQHQAEISVLMLSRKKKKTLLNQQQSHFTAVSRLLALCSMFPHCLAETHREPGLL